MGRVANCKILADDIFLSIIVKLGFIYNESSWTNILNPATLDFLFYKNKEISSLNSSFPFPST
jgi:hypothetical protein